MSTFGNRSTSAGSRGAAPGAESSFLDPWAGSRRRASTVPPGGYGSGGGSSDSLNPPGSITLNPTDPFGSLAEAQKQTTDVFQGVKNAIFGTSAEDAAGKHGGIFGDVPLVGALARGATEAVGNVVGAGVGVAAGAVDVVGGALEHIPAGNEDQLKVEFDKIPGTSPAKVAALEELKGGGLIGPARGHIMSSAIRAHQEELGTTNPQLFAGMFTPPGSVADTVTNLFDSLGFAQRATERLIAGTAKPSTGGMSQLEAIMAVGRGEIQWAGSSITNPGAEGGGLNPVEQVVFDKVQSGEWTETQALDFMASHGIGLSHSQLVQIMGTFATDPLTVAGVVMSAGASLGVTGARLAASGATTARAVGTAGRFNLLGKAAETRAATDLVRVLSYPYQAAQGNALGKSAKIVRTIIDPLHQLDLHLPKASANVDLLSDVATKAVVDVHGPLAHRELLSTMASVAPEVSDEFSEGLAIYSGNVTRQVVANNHRGSVFLNSVSKGEELVAPGASTPTEVIDALIEQQTRGVVQQIAEQANRFRIRVWDEPALQNLTDRVISMLHVPEDDAARIVLEANDDQRALLHASTYGLAQRRLLDGVANSVATPTGLTPDMLHRLILVNRTTLTKLGAEGILQRLGDATGDVAAQIDEMRAAQDLYPSLRYISIDPTDQAKSIEDFGKYLKKQMDRLPMQVTDDEIAKLDPALQNLHADMKGEFTLGFRPKDEYLWGLERSNAAEGGLEVVGDVWVDHVADGAMKYRGARALDLNILGQPIVGPVVRAVVKPIDYIEAAGRVIKQQVSGSMIATSARAKFVASTSKEFARAGISKSVAEDIWKGMQDLVGPGVNDAVASPAGLSAASLWKGVEDIVPIEAKVAGFDKRVLLNMMLDAYDGDVRFIGVTQKFTRRAKAVLGKATGANFAGMVAEHAWPLMKFRLNLVFQGQEKIEPWILNAQRGIFGGLGTKRTLAEQKAEGILERMTNLSLVRQGDIDQWEFSAAAVHAAEMRAAASTTGSRLNSIVRSLTDVQGTKRVGMIRTFKGGLGKEMRAVYEKSHPGLWDDMFEDAQRRAGTLLDEDDFAVEVLADKILGNDVNVSAADFKASISPGRWAEPQTIGELRALEMDEMARFLQLPTGGGKNAMTQADIRAAIASGKLSVADVSKALRMYGADPDYIKRVESALNFSWTGFWDEATKAFNLTPGEAKSLQSFFAATARMRNMTPVDYISQVFSPQITGGTEAVIGELGKTVSVMRGTSTVAEPSLAKLAATPEGSALPASTYEDLVRQLSTVFSAHLDSSAKRALLLEFRPTLKRLADTGAADIDLSTVDGIGRLWDADAEEQLAQRIIDYMASPDRPVPPARVVTADEFTQLHPGSQGPQIVDVSYELTAGDQIRVIRYETGGGFFGADLLAAAPEVQERVYTIVHHLMSQFPGLEQGDLIHINIANIQNVDGLGWADTRAFTVTDGVGGGRSSIFLSNRGHGPNAAAEWAERAKINKDFAGMTENERIALGFVTEPGTPWGTSASAEGDITHEIGHAIDNNLTTPIGEALNPDGYDIATRWMDQWMDDDNLGVRAKVSEYSFDADHPDEESFAEIFDLAFNPQHDLTKLPRDVQMAVYSFQDMLEEAGVWTRPAKAGYAAENADVARVAQMFGKWSEMAVADTIVARESSVYGPLFERTGQMPTADAVPYNFTEAALADAATQAMNAKWSDAYRLQYFKQSRNMLERSVNHPIFGIYPASYMWGKIMPEMVRFIAKEPFGVRTGAMAYTLLDIQRAVALQREFDPEFDAKIEDIGHNQALSFLGYMLPSVPWDIQSSFPSWARDLAAQGLENQQIVDAGGVSEGIDLIKPAVDTAKKLSPYQTSIPWAARGLEDVFGGGDVPAIVPETTGPVSGLDLGPTLEQVMQELRSVLGG